MGTFTAADVKCLRDMTGVGMMKCKEALTVSNGNMDIAIDWLRRKGEADAIKKAGRTANEGRIYADVINGIAVIVEVRCETDFTSHSDVFKEFVYAVALTISVERPENIAELLSSRCADFLDNSTVQDYLNHVRQCTGENIRIQRFAYKDRYRYAAYTHMNGRVAVLMELDTRASYDIVTQVGRNLAMQVAALNPRFLDMNKVPSSVLNKERDIMLNQLDLVPGMVNKPEKVKERIISGKLNKFYAENCLMQQEFVNKDIFTGLVAQYVKQMERLANCPIKVCGMIRYERGEVD